MIQCFFFVDVVIPVAEKKARKERPPPEKCAAPDAVAHEKLCKSIDLEVRCVCFTWFTVGVVVFVLKRVLVCVAYMI